MWGLLWPAVALLASAGESWGLVWEYGQDRLGLVIIDQLSGQIKPLERTKQIALRVPNCMDVKYVKVEVQNRLSTPTASFKKSTSIVKISYNRLSQVTRSKYKITAKGKRNPQCNKDKRKVNKEKHKIKIGGRVPPSLGHRLPPPFKGGKRGKIGDFSSHGIWGSAGNFGEGSISIDYGVTGGNGKWGSVDDGGSVGWFNGGKWGWAGSSGSGSGGLFVDYFNPEDFGGQQEGRWGDNGRDHFKITDYNGGIGGGQW